MDIVLGTTKVQTDAIGMMVAETQKLVAEVQSKIRQVETAAISASAAQNYFDQLSKLGLIGKLDVKNEKRAETVAELRKILAQFQTMESNLTAQRAGIESAAKLVERAVNTVPTGGVHAKAAIEASVASEVAKHKTMVDSARAHVLKIAA